MTSRSLLDRKSTRLNSSHRAISYAVFCLKKKNHLAVLIGILRALQHSVGTRACVEQQLRPLQWHFGKFLVLLFFNDTATTEIYTLSLHDALPIYVRTRGGGRTVDLRPGERTAGG